MAQWDSLGEELPGQQQQQQVKEEPDQAPAPAAGRPLGAAWGDPGGDQRDADGRAGGAVRLAGVPCS